MLKNPVDFSNGGTRAETEHSRLLNRGRTMKKKTGSIFDDALANNRARLDEMLKPMQIDAPDETQSAGHAPPDAPPVAPRPDTSPRDRKSTRLNSSHVVIS